MSEASSRPRVVVVAGPNGAGKTTASQQLLQGELRVNHFVNADVIARGLSGFDPDAVAADAARILIERMDKLAAAREDFAFETTLASRTNAARLKELRSTGYVCYVVFFYLADAAQAVERVAGRVAAGGHDVPEATIRLRYDRGLRNFFRLYQRLADGWYFYDNSAGGAPRLVASGSESDERVVTDPKLWQSLRERYA